MRGKYYIDNIDIYSRFGIMIKDGSYKDLLAFPALKDPEKNDWPEEDGIEPDLDSPVLEPKTVTISFTTTNPNIEANEFIHFISQPGYRTLYIVELNKKWILRLNSQGESNYHPQATTFSLQFVDDIPSESRKKNYPSASGGGIPVINTGYEMDSIPFSQYGIVVESGLNDILKSPTIKPNLIRNFQTSDGQEYDKETIVFNSKEVTLTCSFITSSVKNFWECYTAFFNDLIQPGERFLYCDHTGEEYPCYYKKSSGFNIEEKDIRFICTFNLTLEFISSRINETEYLLTTEDNRHIVLEDGETVVDMKINNN